MIITSLVDIIHSSYVGPLQLAKLKILYYPDIIRCSPFVCNTWHLLYLIYISWLGTYKPIRSSYVDHMESYYTNFYTSCLIITQECLCHHHLGSTFNQYSFGFEIHTFLIKDFPNSTPNVICYLMSFEFKAIVIS